MGFYPEGRKELVVVVGSMEEVGNLAICVSFSGWEDVGSGGSCSRSFCIFMESF